MYPCARPLLPCNPFKTRFFGAQEMGASTFPEGGAVSFRFGIAALQVPTDASRTLAGGDCGVEGHVHWL